MKKVYVILLIVIVPLVIYVAIIIYVNNQLNNVPKPLNQAIKDIKNPSFVIDVFNDDTELPPIKTSVQSDLENLDPAIINELMAEYTASNYDNFLDFYQGN